MHGDVVKMVEVKHGIYKMQWVAASSADLHNSRWVDLVCDLSAGAQRLLGGVSSSALLARSVCSAGRDKPGEQFNIGKTKRVHLGLLELIGQGPSILLVVYK